MEGIPDNSLFVDVLHRAVKRMMEGDDTQGAAAPNTRVVNLSIGDPARQLGAVMSPTARLLDYLAYKYNILFIISAGNHAEIAGLVKETFHDLKSLDIAQGSKVFGTMIKDNQRNLRVLAPADSLNGLTIGALYDDFTDPKAIDLLSRPTYFIMAAGPLFGRRLNVDDGNRGLVPQRQNSDGSLSVREPYSMRFSRAKRQLCGMMIILLSK